MRTLQLWNRDLEVEGFLSRSLSNRLILQRLVGGAHSATAESRSGDRSYRCWWAEDIYGSSMGFLSRSLSTRLIAPYRNVRVETEF